MNVFFGDFEDTLPRTKRRKKKHFEKYEKKPVAIGYFFISNRLPFVFKTSFYLHNRFGAISIKNKTSFLLSNYVKNQESELYSLYRKGLLYMSLFIPPALSERQFSQEECSTRNLSRILSKNKTLTHLFHELLRILHPDLLELFPVERHFVSSRHQSMQWL